MTTPKPPTSAWRILKRWPRKGDLCLARAVLSGQAPVAGIRPVPCIEADDELVTLRLADGRRIACPRWAVYAVEPMEGTT